MIDRLVEIENEGWWAYYQGESAWSCHYQGKERLAWFRGYAEARDAVPKHGTNYPT